MPDDKNAESSPAQQELDLADPRASTAETFVDEPQSMAQDATSDSSPDEQEAQPEEQAESESTDESVTASEAANRSSDGKEAKPESKAERRIKQLTAQLRSVERQMQALQQGKPAGTPLQAPVKPNKPDINQFDTVEAYEKAMDGYSRDMAGYEAQVAVAKDRQEREQRVQAEQMQAQEAQIRETWGKREQATRSRIPDFNTVEALKTVEPSPVMDGLILDSDIGPDLLWYLHENPDQAEEIRNMNPYKAARAMTRLEDRIAAEIKGIKPKAPPPKPIGQVGGRASAPSRPKDAHDILYG